MNKQTLTATIGLPASGKDYWCRQEMEKHPGVYKRVNKDDLRTLLDLGKWSGTNEKFILKARDNLIKLALSEGFSVICTDTNLHQKHIDRLKEIADTGENIVEFKIQDFRDVPLATCLERDYLRTEGRVGSKVIMSMFNQFLKPQPPKIEHDPKLPNAVICDLDGTLALFGDKNPYDRDFENDSLNQPVATVLWNVHQTGLGAKIIFVSGRKNKFLEQTKKFLLKNGFSEIIYEALYMPRADDDNRKDTVIKKEIYEEHLKGKYNILFVIDDRPQIVKFWREEIGLFVFDVNQSGIDF